MLKSKRLKSKTIQKTLKRKNAQNKRTDHHDGVFAPIWFTEKKIKKSIVRFRVISST
jgi:hypothetical protein